MKKLKLFFACLLMALLSIGQMWAAEQVAYTLTPTAGSDNGYATSEDIVIDGITWNVTGNATLVPWRLGGKNTTCSATDREVYSKTAMGDAITKVELTVGAASSITVNSLTLIVASDADFNTQIDEVTGTFAANSTITFQPTSPATEWATGAYYKFVFNLTVSATSNKFVEFSSAKFYKEVATETCVTPTFSPAAGTFYGSQEITLSTTTTGASIYYTLDGTTPSSSNGTLYEDPFTITETKTVKAIAVKDGATDSGVAEATYTAGATVSSYVIDFETNNLAAYVNWVFDKLAIRTSTITAHGGTYYGGNANNSTTTSGTTSATITTAEKIATPGALTFYISKESTNSTASSWKAQVSEDGDTWTDVQSFAAQSMTKGDWDECTADLSAYTNVYVRISYGSSGAIRAIDDISLSTTPSLLKPTIEGVENFVNTTEVTISHATADAIYYTTNGDAPTTSSTEYTAPFELNATATVKAIAVKGGVSSEVAEKTFTKIVPWSVAEANEQLAISTPQNGKYVRGIISQIDGYSSNAITYWISDDGSTTDQLEVYKGKNLNNTNFSAISDLALGDVVVVYGNLKVYTPSAGGSINEFDAGNYLVSKEAPAVAAPVFSPDGGGFMGETDVTITCETAGSAIYYTLDGTTPSKSSSVYSTPIHLDATTTITAIAYVGDDASLVISKTFTLTAPMTVAAALTALDSENPINNVAVAGIISTAPSSNPSSGRLTYYISDDGSASNELEVFNGFGLGGASFSDKTDLQVGDEVTVFGNLTIFNSTTKEFAEGSRLIAFNRPVVPSISADPVAVDATVHAGQSVTITYANWGTVSVADAAATLWDNEACDEAFSGEWISNVDVAANFESVSFDIAANTGEARTAYMKIYALGDDATTEAVKVIAISQEAYVAPALPASLPFAFDGGKEDIASTQGMSQEGLGSDYNNSPKLKFDNTGDWVIIEIASDPGKLTYDIIGNGFSGGTFKVQQSVDGLDYSDVVAYTELGAKTSEEKTLAQTTRFVKFIYVEKSSGNVALGNIAIAKYVAPAAVETPTISGEENFITSTTVTLSCATDGATIYYTTDGTTPTNESAEYTAEFSLTETATVKVIAVKGSDVSAIAEKAFTKIDALGTMDDIFTAATTAGGTAADVAITFGNWVVSGVSTNGKNVFLTDGTKGLIINDGGGSMGFAVGDILSGTAVCKVELKNGSAQLTALSSTTTGLSVTTGGTVTLNVLDADGIATLTGVNTGSLIKVSGACTSENSKYYIAGVQLYNTLFAFSNPTTGTNYECTGVFQLYGSTKEMLPRSAADIVAQTSVATPTFSPAAGTYTSAQNVAISCETDEVTIYYTTDGTTPTNESTAYTGAINVSVSMTIKAIAYKNEDHSEVASAAYTINIPEDESVRKTWDLSIASYDANPTEEQVTWSATYVNMVVDKAEASTAANNYLGGDANNRTSSRFYKNSTLTITPNGKEITSIVFTATSESYATALLGSTWTNASASVSGATVTVTPTDGKNAISAVVGGTCGFTSVQVNYKAITPEPTTYTVTYVLNGGTGTTPTQDAVEATTVITLAGVTGITAPENKEFDGWLCDIDDVKYAASAEYTMTAANTTFTAQWKDATPEPPTPAYTNIRTGLTAGNYYTVCWPKAMTAIKGGTLWSFAGKDASMAYLIQEDAPFEAGKPYIIYAESDKLEAVVEGDDAAAGNHNGLYGTLSYMNKAALEAAGATYMLYHNELRPIDYVNNDNYLAANRAYIVLSEISGGAPSGQAPGRVRSVPMHQDTATGMDELNASETPVKMMIDGQLFIIRGEKMYDATGRLVK